MQISRLKNSAVHAPNSGIKGAMVKLSSNSVLAPLPNRYLADWCHHPVNQIYRSQYLRTKSYKGISL